MNIPRASYHRLIVLLPLAALGLGLVAWGLGKGLGQTSLVPVFGMVGALALAVCLMIVEMVRSGKKYASGAKKRRQALLPFVYGKKGKAAT
jgi:hypothetical protein